MNVVEIGKSNYKNEDIFPPEYFQINDINNIGKKFSDFEMLKLLGKGAFGKVYKVKSKLNNQIYAMKIFDKNINIIEENLKIKVVHPNIINTYHHFKEKEKLYLIMEYMDNGNLKDYISINKINNVLSENQILCILLQTIWPLYYLLHNEKIIVRNIKPENILIDKNLRIKLGEFYSTMKNYENNIIKEDDKHPYELELNNELIKSIWKRTKKYMSNRLNGPEADIYSLGKVLEELLMLDSTDSKATRIINKMCEEKEVENKIENLFRNVSDLFNEHQQNSSIESIVLCLKSFQKWSKSFMDSFQKWSKSFMGKKECGNKVLKIFNEILVFINDKKSNFYNFNYFINEFRLNLNQEINNINEIEEIDPIEVYLYLINIIINEAKKEFFKNNKNNICENNLLNSEKNDSKFESNKNKNNIENDLDIPLIKQISGLIRIQSECQTCHFTKYQLNRYLLLEVEPKEQLKTEKSQNKIDLEDLIIFDKNEHTNHLECNKCFKKTEHKCSKEYSLPDCLVISIKEKLYGNFKDINIKEEITFGKQTLEKKEKKYQLIALIKINRNKNETLVYSFSKFNNDWFLSQRYKGIERIKMDEWHLRSKKVRMLFYQAIPEK